MSFRFIIQEADSSSALSDYVPFDVYESQATKRAKFLDAFSNYQAPGWDGEDAVAVEPADIDRARTFLRSLPVNVPAPEAAPGADGTICMDWETRAGVVRVDVKDHAIRYFYKLADGQKDERVAPVDAEAMYVALGRVFGQLYPRVFTRIIPVPQFTTRVAAASSPRWSKAA